MDSFEAVVAAILHRRGYWTQTSVKVPLTKEEKHAIQRPSSPRWELDVVGYRGATNELLIVECKSYLDSSGVDAATFEGGNPKNQERYKMFFDDNLRKVVLNRLVKHLVSTGFCSPRPRVRLGLAAGKVKGKAPAAEKRLQRVFARRRWIYLGPTEIRNELRALRHSGYENTVAAVVAKLLLRGSLDADGNDKSRKAVEASRGDRRNTFASPVPRTTSQSAHRSDLA